ncbi:uncharacterized protein LOC128167655 [Crassostrea angulata]|uniref:uncharacterized protein LOC128167655 n=1 Tax=Magallana angulata TaxID=2784310 RepID=UPI0022B1C521|nr:uncharacterized protein LOC128167655 [Crassostrea angulata]
MEYISTVWNQILHMSESVFMGMCLIAGTSQQVSIRREVKDIDDLLNRLEKRNGEAIDMLSGSRREGFRLKDSDTDNMHWPNDHRVVMDMSQSEFYNTAITTLILSDSSESPPGFTLLQLLTPTRNSAVSAACIIVNNDSLYLSSFVYKQVTCSNISVLHGPCSRYDLAGEEYDHAYCFASDFWPPSASSWIDRCHSWPDPEVVEDIVRNGCHFVAIGHPLGLHENEEWRISFSLAELKLVSFMSHCQFLTYGLLKIFLNEVINLQTEETAKLLCSYHMKTAIFWAIQQNTLDFWCPQNLLVGFWICFKIILKWVYVGVCPSFFIPENNLFLAKVYGMSQNRLFLQLHELYKKGLACLLQSSSIRSFISQVLYNPRLYICTDENVMWSEVETDLELFYEMNFFDDKSTPDLHRCMKHIIIIEQMINSHLTGYQVLRLQRHTAVIFQHTAFVLERMNVNKHMYIADKMSRHMLKFAANFGDVSDMLYIAMSYYKTCRYMKTLYVLEMTKSKLIQPCLLYRRHVDPEWYTGFVGGQSWSSKLKKVVARDIRLYNRICYINELLPEQHSSQQNWSGLYIPVFVFLHFLEFLSYLHVDTTLSQTALDELQVLVHHDRGRYVCHRYRDISWEILGICQQMAGNLQAALYSYQQSLMQHPFNGIRTATQRRIQDIEGTFQH